MKSKIIIFIVGLLLGAIISTGSIYIYTVANSQYDNQQQMQIGGQGMGGQMNQNGGTPPEIPNNNQTTN